MNPRFLAAVLWVLAAVILALEYAAVTEAARRRDPRAVVSVILAAATLVAVFVNAGADLW